MLAAFLQGKIPREFEGMEDLLTSSVFGLMQLMPPSDGIAPFLRLCRTVDGDRPLQSFAPSNVTYEYWPTWSYPGCYPCEPDVILDCTSPDSKRLLILIEAKFNSGKSSYADPSAEHSCDQPSREWPARSMTTLLSATRFVLPCINAKRIRFFLRGRCFSSAER